MTVSTVVDHNDYTGNGVTTSFPYTFRIFKKTDLAVSVVDLNENITVLVLDTDYTVTNAGGYNGGNVVLTAPLATGWQISIARELEPTQETDLRNQGKFFAEVHEDAFDKLTMLIQQVGSMFRLALRKPTSIANWYDALNNYIRNLKDPKNPQDAATKNYVDNVSLTSINRTIRVPDAYIDPLPPIAQLEGSIIGILNGKPVPFPVPSGTAADVFNQLASSADGKGDELLTVKQPFLNSVPRTQHDKNADWISVKDFGAKGDGTTDDTNAFKTALAASYQVFVPEGEYKITDGLKPRDGTSISGAGKYFTKLKLYTNDVDLITLGWDCVLENISLESMLPDGTSYAKGLLRLQSLTNPQIPPAAVALGGLSYGNKIRNVELRRGQSYNLYSFGIGYTEWYNSDSLLARGATGIQLDGSDSYVARGTTLYMHGVNKITACTGGDGMTLNNQFAMTINGIFEGNNRRAISVYGYSESNHISGYFENNFFTGAGGTGNGDAVVVFESSITRGCSVTGYFDTLNAQNALQIHGLATGFNNRAQYSVREYSEQRSYNRKNGFLNFAGINCQWEIDNALQYYKEANLGEVRSSGKLTFNQCFMFSPYSMLRNPKFNSWSSAMPDNWTGSAVKVSGGYAGSDYYANLNSYPSTYLQQNSINTRFEHSLVYCSLVMVGRGGHSININSTDYNGTNRTVVVIATSSGNTFLEIPQQNFGDEWDAKIISLNEVFTGDLPPKSSITGMTINVYCSSGTNIGYVGLHDNSAGMFIPSDK